MYTLTNDAQWKETLDIEMLKGCPCEPQGSRHRPVNQGMALQMFKNEINKRGISVTKEQGLLDKTGRKFMYVANIDMGENDERGYNVGYVNCNDRSLSWRGLVGENVFICSNMVISANIIGKSKHTSSIHENLLGKIGNTFENLDIFMEKRENEVWHMKDFHMEDVNVGRCLLNIARNNIVPANNIPKIVHEWDNPSHDDFRPRNAWSFLNCCTEINKQSRNPGHFIERSDQLNNVVKEIVGI